jgi:TBC1 domain family member 7
MDDTRNFRSSYYEKVGCRSVEEKKSLEILLKENPVNLPKLKQFLKLFSVPSIHRSLLYNLALNVYPIYMESKEW